MSLVNENFTITKLKNAVDYDLIDYIKLSLQQYGLPQSETELTDYSILQAAIVGRKTDIASLLINAGCCLYVNDSDPSRTPLALAIATENKVLTALLLNKQTQLDNDNDAAVALHLAAQRQSLKMLQFLLHYPLDINYISNGRTPFQVFLENTSKLDDQRNIDIIKLFLDNGASINFKMNNSQNALHHIIKIRDKDIIQTALQITDNINEQDNDKSTALHALLNQQYPENTIVDTVKLMIAKGVILDIQDVNGNTVSHLAAKYKYREILQILRSHKWDVNCCNQEGNTVLHLILESCANLCRSNQYFQNLNSTVKLWIFQGARVDIQNIYGLAAFHLAAKYKLLPVLKMFLSLSYQWDVNCGDEESNTVLHLFFQDSHEFFVTKQNCQLGQEIVNLLVRRGANIDFQNVCGNTVCHLAVKNKQLQFLRILLKYQWNVNSCDLDGNTVLHLLLANSEEYLKNECNEQTVVDIVKELLLKGAKVDLPNILKGETAFHLAAKYKFLKVLQSFLQYQFNVNCCDQDGNTGLHLILQNSREYLKNQQYHQIITDIVIFKGPKLDIQDKFGNTVCHIAAKFKFLELLQICLRYEWNVNICDSENNTILHVMFLILQNIRDLSKDEHSREIVTNIIQSLILKGAEINIQNKCGNTACHLAVKYKSQRILQMFLRCQQWNVNCLNIEGNSVLHLFLENSMQICKKKWYLEVLEHILKQNPIELLYNKKGQSPLHIAAMNEQTKILNDLLSMPVDLSASDSSETDTVLFIFMKNLVNKNTVCIEDIDIVTKLISKGSNPVARHLYHGRTCTPLHFALRLRNKEIILSMLKCNFDFDVFNRAQKKSILHFLCFNRYSFSANFTETEDTDMTEIAKICIEKGANVDALDRDSKTPLYWAVLMRRKDTVKMLLDFGADANLCDKKGRTILGNLMRNEIDVECMNNINHLIDGRSGRYYTHRVKKQIPKNIERDSEIAQMLLLEEGVAERIVDGQLSIFHYCAMNSYLDMLLKIIPYCQNPDVRDSSKNTILRTLLTKNINVSDEVERKVANIVAVLLSKGAPVKDLNENNETLLHLAAKGKHFEVSKILLKNDACATDLDINGNSVLHLLSVLQLGTKDSNNMDLTRLFISNGCNINAKNNSGMTPLLLAIESGSIDMFTVLKKHGASMTCTEGEEQNMPIHLAAKNNCQGIVEKLIKYGIDVNVRRKDRKTPLHLSATHQSSNTTRLLLEKGAVTDLKDAKGKTPLHYACWYDSLDNINELLEYGADINVEDNFGATPLMFNRFSNNTWYKLNYHVVKSRIAKMIVSESNENYIRQSMQETNYIDTRLLKIFENTAIKEISRIEVVPIAVRTSLADILKMSANKLAIFKCNEELKKHINGKDFKEKYPIYSDLLKACYRKGIIRNDLILSAKDDFRQILGLPLPDICCEVIFQYLDQENLHNLAEAAKVKISQRKRFLAEIKHSVPAKRVRRLSV